MISVLLILVTRTTDSCNVVLLIFVTQPPKNKGMSTRTTDSCYAVLLILVTRHSVLLILVTPYY